MTLQAAAVEEAVAQPAEGQKKLWGGRFTGATDPLMDKFNESLPMDKRMWKEDIQVPWCLNLARYCDLPLQSKSCPAAMMYSEDALHLGAGAGQSGVCKCSSKGWSPDL